MKLFKYIQNRGRRRNIAVHNGGNGDHGWGLPVFFTACGSPFKFRVAHLYDGGNQAGGHRRGRQALNLIRDKIREGKLVYVGNCSSPAALPSIKLQTRRSRQRADSLSHTNIGLVHDLLSGHSTTTNRLQHNVSNSITTYTNTLAKYLTNQIVFDAGIFRTIS